MNEIKPRSFLSEQNLKTITLVGLSSVISWGAWLLVIYNLDPYESAGMALPFFFTTFTFAISGTFACILFFLKRLRVKNEITSKHATISLRQGILLGICSSICLLLLMLGLLRIWNGFLLVILMMLIEFYMSGKDDLN